MPAVRRGGTLLGLRGDVVNPVRLVVTDPYRHGYRLARRDGLPARWARHLWWRHLVAGLAALTHLGRPS